MPTSLAEVVQTAIAIGVGIVFGGTIVRVLVTKWLQGIEDFQKATTLRLENMDTALNAAKVAAKEYVDVNVSAVRREGETARNVLRDHVDREDTTLRERTHSLDTRTQIIANNVGLLKEEIIKLAAATTENTAALHEAQTKLTEALHDIKVTISHLTPRAS